ncbi:MAG: 3-deoxy-D-manno-octulosonic acid transferase [bacterium]
MALLYDALYLATSPALAAYLGYRCIAKGKYRQSARGMLGIGLGEGDDPHHYSDGSFWVHAVSVGEVVAAKALLPHLRASFPQWPIVASTITETGQQRARELLTETRRVFYYPIDLSFVVWRFLRFYNPSIYILMETELWPNFLTMAQARGTMCFLMNGKISDRSFRRYRRFLPLFRKPLAGFKAFCMQTEEDAAKIGELCGSKDRVHVTGNLKFDAPGSALNENELERLRKKYGLRADQPVLVAGSTHPGEESVLLSVFAELRKKIPGLVLFLAPRHPERFDSVAHEIEKSGLRLGKTSRAAGESAEIWLLDEMGQLQRHYGLGQIAFVGGSLAPIGGHNLLEAAVHSIPVAYGPHMHKQPEMRRMLGPDGGGVPCTERDLAANLERLYSQEDERRRLGKLARQSVDRNRGSARACAEIIKTVAKRF